MNFSKKSGKDGKTFFPMVYNGYHFFIDRHSESKDVKDDTDLLNRNSLNFAIAIYDTDWRDIVFEYGKLQRTMCYGTCPTKVKYSNGQTKEIDHYYGHVLIVVVKASSIFCENLHPSFDKRQ